MSQLPAPTLLSEENEAPLNPVQAQQGVQNPVVLTGQATEDLPELESLSKRERVYNLTLELREWKERKKRMQKDMNEEIKRIQAEIDAITAEDAEDID